MDESLTDDMGSMMNKEFKKGMATFNAGKLAAAKMAAGKFVGKLGGVALAVMLAAGMIAGGAGCGGAGGKKGAAGDAAGGEAAVVGAVDLYSGYGALADGAGRAEALRAGATARLYRIPPDGAALLPLPGSAVASLNGGIFRIEGAPARESALVVRVETGDGKPTLSALLPPLSAGENNVAVNPETDIEARLFQKMVESGVMKKRDVRPWDIDVGFVKKLVDGGLFFETPGPGDPEKTAEKLLPLAREAYGRYAQSLLGKGAGPDDKRMSEMAKGTGGPLMRMESAREAGALSEKHYEEAATAVGKAAAEAKLARGTMSHEAVWRAARDGALGWAARCMRQGARAAGCPATIDGVFDMPAYGAALTRSLAAANHSDDMRERMKAFERGGGAGDSAPSAVETIARLINPPEKMIEHFYEALARAEAETDGARRFELKKKWTADFRDVLLIGDIGMSAGDVYAALESLAGASRPLAAALADPSADIERVVAAHKEFLAGADAAFKPMGEAVRARYVKLDASDAGRLEWALREICMKSTLWELAPVYYVSADTDGDGAPDNVERVSGSDPADAGSFPTPIIMNTPTSLLPVPNADTDGDGYYDVVERAAGTGLQSEESRPIPGGMKFCEAGKAGCVASVAAEKGGVGRVAGKVEHKGKPMSGATVGLYATPAFINEKPIGGRVAVSNAAGEFELDKTARGKYFVAAFRDSNGDGAPGAGEAVGFAGEVYPTMITVSAENPKATAAVIMIGAAGGPRCAKGKAFDPAAKACADKCPAGMSAFEMTGECECGAGKLLFGPTGACVDKCPDTMKTSAGAGRCECPAGTKFNANENKCECPEGMRLDVAAMECRCDEGMLVEGRGGCAAECPPGYAANEAAGACECPAGSKYDVSAGRCVCGGGKTMNPLAPGCVETCPGGMKPDATGLECACGDKERFDADSKRCECVEGHERRNGGKCAPAGEATQPPRGETDMERRGVLRGLGGDGMNGRDFPELPNESRPEN